MNKHHQGFVHFKSKTVEYMVGVNCTLYIAKLCYITKQFRPSADFAKLRALRAFALSCLTCLHALRVLIFTRLNYAPCLLFAYIYIYIYIHIYVYIYLYILYINNDDDESPLI